MLRKEMRNYRRPENYTEAHLIGIFCSVDWLGPYEERLEGWHNSWSLEKKLEIAFKSIEIMKDVIERLGAYSKDETTRKTIREYEINIDCLEDFIKVNS